MSYSNGGANMQGAGAAAGSGVASASAASTSRSRRELIDRVKYPNPIPLPPYPPKLVKIPAEPSRYANAHFADRLASQQPVPLIVDVHAVCPSTSPTSRTSGRAISLKSPSRQPPLSTPKTSTMQTPSSSRTLPPTSPLQPPRTRPRRHRPHHLAQCHRRPRITGCTRSRPPAATHTVSRPRRKSRTRSRRRLLAA